LNRVNMTDQVYANAMARQVSRYNKNLPKDSLGRRVLSSHLLKNQAGTPPIRINNKTMEGGSIIAELYCGYPFTISRAFSSAAGVGFSPLSILAIAVMRSSLDSRRILVFTISFLLSLYTKKCASALPAICG